VINLVEYVPTDGFGDAFTPTPKKEEYGDLNDDIPFGDEEV